MINKTISRRKRTRRVRPIPSPRQIESACREIRSDWTETEVVKRTVNHRVDVADARFEAHLRFIQILLAGR